jgi:hypothetical protein
LAIDTSVVGTLAAEFMERIEGEYGEGATIGISMVVAEVTIPGVDDDDPGSTEILYRSTDDRGWVQNGLLVAARRAVFSATQPDEDED